MGHEMAGGQIEAAVMDGTTTNETESRRRGASNDPPVRHGGDPPRC